jgi:hypothetical protein
MKRVATEDLAAFIGLDWRRERRRSGRCKPSALGPCAARLLLGLRVWASGCYLCLGEA